MPQSLIRSVREADLEEVRAIYAKEVLEGIASFEIEPPHIEEMRARLHRVQDAKLPYLVSELDGRIAGFAYAVPYRPRPAYRYTVENSVYVARWAQRQGIGSQLLDALVSACERTSTRQMVESSGGSSTWPLFAPTKKLVFVRLARSRMWTGSTVGGSIRW